MAVQVYTNKNVLSATQERLKFIFDEFENIIVSISGGKDSTVLCYMALQEARTRNRKITIFFLDEEAVYQSTIEQVKYLMNLYPENTIKVWYQFPFLLTNSSSLTESYLKCWDVDKKDLWMHEQESFSIKDIPWEKPHIRNKSIGLVFEDVLYNFRSHEHHTAFLAGIRASESLNRFRAVSKNPGYKDILWSTKVGKDNVSFYPLYDWNFHDIWRYIYNNKIKYSPIYDYQWKKGLGLQEIRVSSLIHEKSYKSLVELPEFEPETFDKLSQRVGGIQIGNLYGKTMLRNQKLPKNFHSWLEYRDFLLKTYPDTEKKKIFEQRFHSQKNNNFVARQQCKQLILNDYENNLPVISTDDPRERTKEKWKNLL